MEALGLSLPSLATIARLSPPQSSLTKLRSSALEVKLNPRYRRSHSHRWTVKMQADVAEDESVQQMKEMAAARKRWEALRIWHLLTSSKWLLARDLNSKGNHHSRKGNDLVIREGKVKVLTPKEAGYAIQLSNKTLLDVRPSTEHEKAWVKGSTWIPIFDVDDRLDVGTAFKKITNFVMGGWWSGIPMLSFDNQFITKVEEKFPKDADLIVACQRGLRSLAACEQLYNAGYGNLFWVEGGLEAAEEEDLDREGPQPFKFAGIGGVSEFLGFTDQQRAAAAKAGLGYRLMFTARLVGILLVADGLFFGAQQFSHFLQDLRSH